jgi:hypothetical protein
MHVSVSSLQTCVQIRNNGNAGLEVLTAVGMKDIIFLEVTSCSLVESANL